MPVHLPRLDLEVGDRRMELGIPVDEPLVAIDQPLAVEIDEDLAHRMAEALVHGEALARPVGGGAEPAQLGDDGAARVALPFPDLVDELGPADGPHIGAGAGTGEHDALALQLALDHGLGGDPGMVRARLPQHVAAAHALIAHQHVLQREGQRMAHVQDAGHIRRRHHDGEGNRRGQGVAGEIAAALPAGVMPGLDLGRVERLFEHEALFKGRARHWQGRRLRPIAAAGIPKAG